MDIQIEQVVSLVLECNKEKSFFTGLANRAEVVVLNA
jgi:hypothetical protein